MREDIKYWLLLNSVEGVGLSRFRLLVDTYGSPENVLNASIQSLRSISGIDKKTAYNIVHKRDEAFVTEQLELAEKHNVDIITYQDDEFPENLSNIYDPPIFLYVKGKLYKEDKNAVAVVGSRSSTVYGKTITEKLSGDLAARGITIVSGLARGIDSAAHKGALNVGGRTISVLGCGVDVVYPPENRQLMRNIAQQGAIVSEYPMGTTPIASNFPGRNRIISGLSLGVLVTEARKKSGALITVNFATEQGREVFAVPGKITSRMSKGSNKLIKDGAKLVESSDDVLNELKHIIGLLPEQKKVARKLNLTSDEQKIFDLLSNEPIHIDKLSQKTGLTTQSILTILLSLELKGIVNSLPGKKFIAV